MSTRRRPRRLSTGHIIDGRYEVVDFIGAGGFAAVYEGRHVKMGRSVAIKILDLFDDGSRSKAYEAVKQRFEREARVMANLKHSAVVNVHDFGFIAEPPFQPYIVMELLEGHTLEHELSEFGAIPPSRALPLIKRCLEALGEGHQKGVVHRDLKPANIFITDPHTPQEDLRVLDYGIASISQSKEDRLTTSGQIIGTYRYLSPEYIQGRTATPALDVYQMGLIVCEILSGEPVMDGGNHFSTLMMHVEGRLSLPVPLLTSPLGPILARALARDHEARYQDAYDFHAALETITPEMLPACDSETTRVSLSEFFADGPERATSSAGSRVRPARPATSVRSFEVPDTAVGLGLSDDAGLEDLALAETKEVSGVPDAPVVIKVHEAPSESPALPPSVEAVEPPQARVSSPPPRSKGSPPLPDLTPPESSSSASSDSRALTMAELEASQAPRLESLPEPAPGRDYTVVIIALICFGCGALAAAFYFMLQ